MPATPATTLNWASREVCEGVSEIVAFGLAMFFLRHHQCKIQNAKCKECITCTDSKLRFDDDSPENPGDLLRLLCELLQFWGGVQFQGREDTQPVCRLAGFTERDFDIPNEFAFGRAGLGFLEIGADGSS